MVVTSRKKGNAYCLQQYESLIETLAQSDDLETTLKQGLSVTLDAIDHPGGVLIVQSQYDLVPTITIKHDLSKEWDVQIGLTESSLNRTAQQVIASEQEIDTDTSLSLAIALPLTTHKGIQGALLIHGKKLSPDELTWLKRFARLLGYAILSRIPLRKSSKRSNKNLALFQIVSKIISSNIDYDETQRQLLVDLCHILDTEGSSLVLWNEEINQLVIKRYGADEPDMVYSVRSRREKGVLESCLNDQKTLTFNNAANDPLFRNDSDYDNDFQPRSLLCTPLIVEKRLLGALQVYNKINGLFDGGDQELIETIARWVAYTLYNASLVRQIKIDNAELEASRWELLRSRNTLRALFDSLPLSMYIIDQKYSLIAVNMNRSTRVNDKPSILVGRLCYEALYQRNDPCPGCRVSETLFGGQSTMRTERRWETEDEPFEWEISSYPIHGGTGQTLQAVLVEQDVTEKRRLEVTLAQSEKLAAVGQLAAGVAHEINNPLAAIIANAQILQRQIPNSADSNESIDLILQASARASQVVHNLLDFARKEQYEFVPTDLNETIRNALSLVQHEIVARSINLTFEPGQNLPLIMASKDHLQGVWLNLIMNAMDALSEGTNEIRINTQLHGSEFRVVVSDTGHGMPPERITRIFEPFYTTKESGRGTGLGLSVCHRIVKQHGGYIEVDSHVGAGTKFTVILPATPG